MGSPSSGPTPSPSSFPTSGPTASPTTSPTPGPSSTPTAVPTSGPTAGPTASGLPECFEGPFVKVGCGESPVLISSFDDNANSVNIQRSVAAGITVSYYPLNSDTLTSVTLESDDQSISPKCTEGLAYITVNYSGCDYEVVVPCNESDLCSILADRRLHDEAFKHDIVHDSDDEDVPYCLSKDYPCEGEEDNMVYVCHYSARQGYQTFCVPEADSDILRFYPND